MSAPAAISGDFATYKHVQGRKMLQLVIEVPAEMASAVFAALGTPGSGEAIPVALARLIPTCAKNAQVQTSRQPFTEKPYATQAALRCQEAAFQMFLIETNRMPDGQVGSGGLDRAAEAVRAICGVKSRADIGKSPNDRSANDSGFKWRALEAEYYSWQRGRR